MQTIKPTKNSTYVFDLPESGDYSNYLQAVEITAKQRAASCIIGPMTGDTWHRYRTVVSSSELAPFLFEPYNSDWQDFVAAAYDRGFSVEAAYQSAICDLRQSTARITCRSFEQLRFAGIDLDDFEHQLHEIYKLSSTSFNSNYLYSAIDESTFMALYVPLKNILAIDPGLSTLVFDGPDLVGLALVVKNTLDKSGASAILKTLVRRSDKKYQGLGLSLVLRSHELACQRGYKNLILALYKEDGFSSYIPGLLNAQVVRRYALFGKRI